MTHDPVNHPAHYTGAGGLEAIDVIEAFGLGATYHLGNAVKYLLRAGRKDDAATDLRKADWYFRRWRGRVGPAAVWPIRLDPPRLILEDVADGFGLSGPRRAAVIGMLDLGNTRIGTRRLHQMLDEIAAAIAAAIVETERGDAP